MRRLLPLMLLCLVTTTVLVSTPSTANAASSYRMNAKQTVWTSPSATRRMGAVPRGERVQVLCQDRGKRVRGSTLWDYIQYTVSGSGGRVKRGWVPDNYVSTGSSSRLKGVRFGNCPPPLTRPGRAVNKPADRWCYGPVVKRYDGSSAWMEIGLKACMQGTRIMTVEPVKKFDYTWAGTIGGYELVPDEPRVVIGGGAARTWTTVETDWRLRSCVGFAIFQVCSPWERSTSRVLYYGPGYKEPERGHTEFATWCTNTACRVTNKLGSFI